MLGPEKKSKRSIWMKNSEKIKSAIESMMYVWGGLLDVREIAQACEITKEEALSCVLELKDEYEQSTRGIIIRRVNNSFQFVTRVENAPYIEKLCTPVKVKKLSQSAIEVLAIIAYKQPVTKAEIDAIRGVRSDRAIDNLKNKNLIREKGRSEGVGRPILYATTDVFLKQFGFESLSQLPEIHDLRNIMSSEDEMDDGQISIEDVRKEV